MILRTEKLQKQYRDADHRLVVIESLTHSFPEHGSLAIMGRSGIGKSTLLHLLGGLDRPSSGAVFFGDTNVSIAAADELAKLRGHYVGFIFQFHHLLPEFTALENIAMPLVIAGKSESESNTAATEALERVGLSSRSFHRPSELSGGEQQRVAIARAIVSKPRLLLADEPTGNLDVQTARIVQDLLLGIHRELNNLLIVVTHSAELSSAMESRLEMLPGGALVPQA